MFAANLVTPNSIWSSLPANVFGIGIIVSAAVFLFCFPVLVFL